RARPARLPGADGGGADGAARRSAEAPCLASAAQGRARGAPRAAPPPAAPGERRRAGPVRDLHRDLALSGRARALLAGMGGAGRADPTDPERLAALRPSARPRSRGAGAGQAALPAPPSPSSVAPRLPPRLA